MLKGGGGWVEGDRPPKLKVPNSGSARFPGDPERDLETLVAADVLARYMQ